MTQFSFQTIELDRTGPLVGNTSRSGQYLFWVLDFILGVHGYVGWIISTFCSFPFYQPPRLSLPAQVEAPYQKSICLDHPRQNMSIPRQPQTERTYVQAFVRSKIFLRSSCVPKTLCPDFCASKIRHDQTYVHFKPKFVRACFKIFWVHVQTIVRSKTPMSRHSWGQTLLCVLRAFQRPYVQIFVRPKLDMTRLSCISSRNLCAHVLKFFEFMSRLSCVQKHLCPDIRTVKNFCTFFVRSQVRLCPGLSSVIVM